MIVPKKRLLTRRRAIIGVGAMVAAPFVLRPHPTLAKFFRGSFTAPAPAEAAAVGFNTCFFYVDNFQTGMIDVNATGKPGFLLYPFQPVTAKTTAAGDLSISNGILTMTGSVNEPGGTGYRCRLSTWGFLGPVSGGLRYVSSVPLLPFGFCMKVVYKYDPAQQQNTNTGWPASWGASVMGSSYGPVTGFVGQHTELDNHEGQPQGGSAIAETAAVHNWNNSGSGWGDNFNNNYDLTAFISVNYNNFNSWSTVWRTQAQTGGAGSIKRYFNGSNVSQGDVGYSTGGASTPGASPSNPAGTFSTIETNRMMAIIDAGYLWPLQVQSLGIWWAGS